MPEASAHPEGFRRVVDALAAAGHAHSPRWLDVAARTSQEAADLLGVAVGQIAKSVVFRRREDGRAVLVVTSGDKRVDEIWAAAGHPNGVFRLAPADLQRLTGGAPVADVVLS
jgi:prolyl-tRNA editing enzyme YbaK/EbsC (Cys-tRNA(Pro) deacylase)